MSLHSVQHLLLNTFLLLCFQCGLPGTFQHLLWRSHVAMCAHPRVWEERLEVNYME